MAAAAALSLPWPEAAIIEEPTLDEQIAATARELPQRPLVLGGCCCAHVGAVRELARRHGRIGVVWIDAHGDLNTPASSPSGNTWGMPLRMLIDAGDVAPEDVALLGARALDPPEADFIEQSGIRQELGDLPERLYVALDCDVFEPGHLDVFRPEPGGPTPEALEPLLATLPRPLGAGLTGLRCSERNEAALPRLMHALGL
jgi:arginase